MAKKRFWPFTPGGSACVDLEASTEEQAWKNLEKATAHMPYKSRDELKKRGYEVCEIVPAKEQP